jgi:hypothetical protein
MSTPEGFGGASLAESEWRVATFVGGLIALGTAAFIVVDALGAGLTPLELEVRLAHTLGAAVVTAILWFARKRPTRGGALVATALMVLPFLPSLWLSESTAAASGRPWSPFVGHKLVLSCIAILIPGPPWFGGLMLALFGIEEVALWRTLGLSERAMVAVDEPWASIAHFVVVVVLYGYRVLHWRLERERAQEHAEAEAFQAKARAFLAARDLANTPIQSLVIGVALLERRTPLDPVLKGMRGALARLRTLNSLFTLPGEEPPPPPP